jgi:hypothetical protein
VLPAGAEPEVAPVCQELHPVLLRRDRVLLGHANELQVRDVKFIERLAASGAVP